MILFADPFQALIWTTRLLAIGVLIDTIENFYFWKEFRDRGVFNWKYLREHRLFTRRRLVRQTSLDRLFDLPRWFLWLALRGVAALSLIFFPIQKLSSIVGLTVVFTITSLMNLRSAPYGVETYNRLNVVIAGALLLRSVVPDSLILAKVCLWFIALQACVSYATAGIIKLFNQGWRSGNGLFNVVNNPMNGIPPEFAFFFYRHNAFGKALTWFTLVIECSFPLGLVLGQPFVFFYLAWGILFHLTNAALLGLNKFFWAWMATYPAILYITQ